MTTGILSGVVDTEAQDLESLSNPATQANVPPARWYEGLAGAIPRGIAGAAVDIEHTLAAPFTEPADHWKTLQAFANSSPYDHGYMANVVQGLAEGLTVGIPGGLIGGLPGAAAALTTVFGHKGFEETFKATGDYNLALKAGAIQGIAAGAGAVAPMAITGRMATGLLGRAMAAEVEGSALAGGLHTAAGVAATASRSLATNMAFGATTNVGFGIANRYGMQQLMLDAGRPEMAAQYEVLDTEAGLAEGILGSMFGAYGHFVDVPRSIQQEAVAAHNRAFDAGTMPSVPGDPGAVNLHDSLMNEALARLLTGHDLTLDQQKLVELQNRSVYNQQFFDQQASIHSFMRDQLIEDGYNPDHFNTETTEPVYKVPETDTLLPPTAEGINPLHQQLLSHLTATHPDLQISTGDGGTIKMADVHAELTKHAQEETFKANTLIDTAINCFLRTSGL